ncbi:hypothetical protein K440DRAFT_497800, partial [Wilcoxina mikolae CBS 423.85]
IVGCLAGFSTINDMRIWAKRAFNTLSIVFISMLSVGIGSMIGELGKTIRWKLLASMPHNLQDVEDILSLPSPFASLRRIYRRAGLQSTYPRTRCSLFRWPSRTSSILVSFLFANLLGRLSVATFGLVFSINDASGNKPAIYASSW